MGATVHELAVASDLLDLVLRTARENGAQRALAARLRIGAASCLNPDSLTFGFEALAAGTAAEGCRLEIERTPAEAACPGCEWRGSLGNIAVLACPGCGAEPVRITGGRDLAVDTVTVE
jgi:hydrogenase nickel incorporation protein HypA/HybF